MQTKQPTVTGKSSLNGDFRNISSSSFSFFLPQKRLQRIAGKEVMQHSGKHAALPTFPQQLESNSRTFI